MKSETKESTGWGTAHTSHRFHFFVGKTSACGWYSKRKFSKRDRDTMERSPQDCMDCWKALLESGEINEIPEVRDVG